MKNTVNISGFPESPRLLKQSSIPIRMARNTVPTPKMPRHLAGVTMKASLRRGGSFMTPGSGGSVASASAAKVSMIRLTQSI